MNVHSILLNINLTPLSICDIINPSSEGHTSNQKGFNAMMTMTEKLANSLMDDLAALAISANRDTAKSEEGLRLAREYAKKTFLFLCAEWTDLTGEDWQVIIE